MDLFTSAKCQHTLCLVKGNSHNGITCTLGRLASIYDLFVPLSPFPWKAHIYDPSFPAREPNPHPESFKLLVLRV